MPPPSSAAPGALATPRTPGRAADDPSSRVAETQRRDLLETVVESQPRELADVVATLSWSVTDPDELLEYLQRSVDLAVRVVRGASSAGVTATLRGTLTTTAHSGPVTVRLDAHQYASGAGPCLHAIATGELVTAGTDDCRERWPRFAAAAEDDGIASVLAAPMTLPTGTPLGVLNLYGTDPRGLDQDDLAVTAVLVEHVTRAVESYARLDAAQDLAEGLAIALSRRAVIEQAKGIIMAVRQIDAVAAFAVLRTESQTTNRKIFDLCTDFVAAHTTGGTP